MEEFYDNNPQHKERHGCVTAWLIMMIVLNSITSLGYILAGDVVVENAPGTMNEGVILILGIFGLANVFFAVMLLRWKKLGFWGFGITALAVFVINVSFGLGVVPSLLGLLGIVILFAILQISPKGGQSAWKNLE